MSNNQNKYVKIGYIADIYGFKGYVKLKPVTDNVDILLTSEELCLSSNNEQFRIFPVSEISSYKNMFLVKFEGINDDVQAKLIKKSSVFVHGEFLPVEEDGEIYWYKIDGAKVVDLEGVLIGKLVDYLEVSTEDIFRIELTDGSYSLISNNPYHIKKIDSIDKIIVIDTIGLVSEKL